MTVPLKKSDKMNMSCYSSGLREENILDFSNLQRADSQDSRQSLIGDGGKRISFPTLKYSLSDVMMMMMMRTLPQLNSR